MRQERGNAPRHQQRRGAGPAGILGALVDAAAVIGDQTWKWPWPRRHMQPAEQLVVPAGKGNRARQNRMAINHRITQPARQIERHGFQHLPLKPRDMGAHFGPHGFERSARAARRKVCRLGRRIGKRALPDHIRGAAVTAVRIDHDLPALQAFGDAHLAGAAAGGEHGCRVAGMGVVVGAFDDRHVSTPVSKRVLFVNKKNQKNFLMIRCRWRTIVVVECTSTAPK